jgi:hypothetical protein
MASTFANISLYIPHVFANISKNKIVETFLNPYLQKNDHLHLIFYGRLSPTLVLELLNKVEQRTLLLPPEEGMSILAHVKSFRGSLYFFSGEPQK